MAEQHTPGPWEATRGYNPQIRAGETFICSPMATRDSIGGMQIGEIAANARLIAAAPDLLEAAQFVMRCIESPHPGTLERVADRTIAENKLRAAIAKAKGA